MTKFEKPEITIALFDKEISASDLSSGTGTGGETTPENYTTALAKAKSKAQLVTQQIIVFQK